MNSPELGLHFGIKNINLGKKSLMFFIFAFELFFSSCAAPDNFQIAIRYRKTIYFFTFSNTFSICSGYENSKNAFRFGVALLV